MNKHRTHQIDELSQDFLRAALPKSWVVNDLITDHQSRANFDREGGASWRPAMWKFEYGAYGWRSSARYKKRGVSGVRL